MNQIVSIVGPTATGKTKLALQLIKSLKNDYEGFDIISADSRQVYQGLEIVSGADVPEGFLQINHKNFQYPLYKKDNVLIHGISIIDPKEEWSVAHFQQFAQQIINWTINNNRLAIIVGGTGLYHQHLFNQDPKLKIKPNPQIRKKAERLTVVELQEWLKKIDLDRFNQLNHSDVNNPTRLIRKIEIAEWLKSKKIPLSSGSSHLSLNQRDDTRDLDSLSLVSKRAVIGLKLPLEVIEEKIKTRVMDRLENGAISQVKKLITRDDLNPQVLTATGVREINQFLNKEIDRQRLIDLWTLREFQYAKRQITWWKKRDNIRWMEVDNCDINLILDVLRLLE